MIRATLMRVIRALGLLLSGRTTYYPTFSPTPPSVSSRLGVKPQIIGLLVLLNICLLIALVAFYFEVSPLDLPSDLPSGSL